ASIGAMVSALEANHLAESTLFIISAKHGQSPIDPTQLKSGLTGFQLKNVIKNLVDPVAPIAQLTEDDVALICLQDQSTTAAATKDFQGGQATAFLEPIYSSTTL